MNSVTNVEMQRSAYFVPMTAVRTEPMQNVILGDGQRPTRGQMPSDLASTYPEAVVASSDALGWQNLRALEMRDSTVEWTIPPLENHCIVVQLGPAADASARIGSQSFEHRLRPGEIMIIPSGTPAQWRQRDTAENHTLHLYIHPNFVRTISESMDVDYNQISIAAQFGIRDEHIHHIAMSLQCELNDMHLIGRLYADSLAKVLVMQLIRSYSYLKDLHSNRGGMAPRKLRKALEYINDHLDREQTVALAAVAEEVQMSYFHFSRAFKQATGVSPNVYMTDQRIRRAKKLLSETNLPIADIALRTGFGSQSHFTTTFRRLVWTTPKAYREAL